MGPWPDFLPGLMILFGIALGLVLALGIAIGWWLA